MEVKYDRGGVPYVEVEYLGRTAKISPISTKKSILELGYVYLGAQFEGVVPDVVLPADPASGRGETTLRGYSDDPRLLAIAWQLTELE